MHPEHERSLEEVDKWLAKHVKVINPKKIELFAFEVNWDNFSGSFSIKFDEKVLKDRLKFGLNASGRVDYYLPMFHSPLGVPASYPTVEMSDRTKNAIAEALHKTIPRMKGAGIDHDTGREITYHTPPKERIVDPKLLRKAIQTVNQDYCVMVDLADPQPA